MGHLIITCVLPFLFVAAAMAQEDDWADLNRFKAANALLPMSDPAIDRVVFMGNSITEGWAHAHPAFFTVHPFINRGIGGQTTPQMLQRFQQDVIDLKPAVVVILAGTNDIAGNTGPMTIDEIMDNIRAMAKAATDYEIKVVLCSVLPAAEYYWNPGQNPRARIPALNALIEAYCAEKGHAYVDYYSAMTDDDGGLPPIYSDDGVHPNTNGYRVMEPLVLDGISRALSPKP